MVLAVVWNLVLLSMVTLGAGGKALAGDLDCPDDAILKGDAPPHGIKQWCQLPDATQHGPSSFWYPTGEKRALAHFVHGKLEGPVTEWHRNGKKAEQGFYKDDKRHGAFATWYEDGTKESLEEYQEDVLSGKWLIWYRNGKPMVVSEFRDGKRHGPSASYYENGQIQTQGEFRDGEYDGVWTGWWENGAKKKVAEFDRGVELRREYYPREE